MEANHNPCRDDETITSLDFAVRFAGIEPIGRTASPNLPAKSRTVGTFRGDDRVAVIAWRQQRWAYRGLDEFVMETVGSVLKAMLMVVAGLAALAVILLPLMAVLAAVRGAIRRALGKDERIIPPRPPVQ